MSGRSDAGPVRSADRERHGEQRVDGVLRFGGELVVVIESKTVGHAPSDQSRELTLPPGAEVGHARVVAPYLPLVSSNVCSWKRVQ
jgi:hypothetical protein